MINMETLPILLHKGSPVNPANDKITRDRRNYSGHNLSNNDMDTKKGKKDVDILTNRSADVRYNDKKGKPSTTNATTQELTDNSAYNEIIRERNNYSSQDLSNIERDKMKTKKDIDTSTNYNNDARNNDNTKNLLVIPPHNKRSPVTLQTMKGHHKTAAMTVITIYQTI